MCLGVRVAVARERMGRFLWEEHPVKADIVIPVQDSGTGAASGFAEASGLPLKPMALFKSHYVARTFIDPCNASRIRGNRLKFNPIQEFVEGKRVVVVDDSIVRANVIKAIARALRSAGAIEVHGRISSPPCICPCYYGIDTYRVVDELIARRLGGDVEAIRQETGLDSLGYLGVRNLRRAVSETHGFCDACFTGNYFTPTEK